jgi:hypothetical protein
MSFYDKVHNIHTQKIVSSITHISQAKTGYFFNKDNIENTINYFSKFENRKSSKENPLFKMYCIQGINNADEKEELYPTESILQSSLLKL